MSTKRDMAFERLRRAKPVPIEPLHSVSAAEFLDEFGDDEPGVLLAAGPARGRRRPLLVAALVVLVAGSAVGVATSINREPPAEVVVTSTEVVFNRSAAELPSAGSMIGGVYRTDKLGTPVSMNLHDVWRLERHKAGVIALSDEGIVSIVRPTGLADPTQLAADDPMFTWSPADLDGWLDSIPPSITVVETADGERAGLRVFDVQVDDGVCPGSTACIPILTSSGTFDVYVGSSEQTRMWWFTMEPYVPVVIVAAGPASTIQNADTLVRSMGFGPNAAHPLAQQEPWEAGMDAELPAGRITLPALGGLEFDLPFPAVMRQSDDSVVVELNSSERLEIVIVDRAADGTAVTTVAEVMAALELLADLTSAGSLETPMGEMVVVDIAQGPTTSSGIALLTPELGFAPGSGNDSYRWLVPRSGRLWMIEVENGVLLLSAGVLEGSTLEDPTLERDVIELGDAVARTIRLEGG